jgi:CheY-like chemotaxis protein
MWTVGKNMASVLVIEDDPQNRHLIKTLLEVEGYSVKAVHDVTSAWYILEKELPDLICCDLVLPGTSGLDFLASRGKISGLIEVPVVAVTGNTEHKREAERLGVSAFLLKPFAMSQLLSAVESALVGIHP